MTNEFDVNETDFEGDSMLYYAVSNLNYELVELLLEEGADPAYTDSFGDSAYEMMRVGNEEELIAELEWHLQ